MTSAIDERSDSLCPCQLRCLGWTRSEVRPVNRFQRKFPRTRQKLRCGVCGGRPPGCLVCCLHLGKLFLRFVCVIWWLQLHLPGNASQCSPLTPALTPLDFLRQPSADRPGGSPGV